MATVNETTEDFFPAGASSLLGTQKMRIITLHAISRFNYLLPFRKLGSAAHDRMATLALVQYLSCHQLKGSPYQDKPTFSLDIYNVHTRRMGRRLGDFYLPMA